jgi:DNA repair protein RadC
VIDQKCISAGGMAGTVVDAKRVFQEALNYKASSIILSHNHPSGNLNPSDADIRLTKNLVEAGRVLEISVLDHIIITQQSFYSFADEGMM